MSTTVTYKGNTLTTVSNATKTLKTAGKYMEGDVILVDVTEGGGSGSGVVWQDAQGYIHLSDEGDIALQTKTVTPTESAQTITADAGYYALDEVNVGAISSTYVGSGITRRSSTDLTASGAIVTVQSGYYAEQASKSVASGTAGTPTASKGTVSNHSVSVTPSVTNTTGWITGSTKSGTAVTVTASELASGNKAITENGTNIDVVGYSTVSVDVQGGGGYTWETLFDQDITIVTSSPNYFVFTFTDPLNADETYRVTWGTGGTQYICETVYTSASAAYDHYFLGNDGILGMGTDTGEPFVMYRDSATRMVGATNQSAGSWHIKVEKQVSSSATLIEKSVAANGTYNASDDDADGYSKVTVNVSGSGGGIEYETGTWTPSEDVASYTIPFTNTHTVAPFYYLIASAQDDSTPPVSTNLVTEYFNSDQIFGEGYFTGAYGYVLARYANASGQQTGTTVAITQPYTVSTNTGTQYSRYWATETGITAYTNSTSRYWGAGRTYKWIAVWTPTT